jgi:hypothetical protein
MLAEQQPVALMLDVIEGAKGGNTSKEAST